MLLSDTSTYTVLTVLDMNGGDDGDADKPKDTENEVSWG